MRDNSAWKSFPLCRNLLSLILFWHSCDLLTTTPLAPTTNYELGSFRINVERIGLDCNARVHYLWNATWTNSWVYWVLLGDVEVVASVIHLGDCPVPLDPHFPLRFEGVSRERGTKIAHLKLLVTAIPPSFPAFLSPSPRGDQPQPIIVHFGLDKLTNPILQG